MSTPPIRPPSRLGPRGSLLAVALWGAASAPAALADDPPPTAQIPPDISVAAYGIAPMRRVEVVIPPAHTSAGTYPLDLPNTPKWQHNTLILTDITPDLAKGVLNIDLNIGPEAREPTPDERLHALPFEAKRVEGSAATYTFEVTVGSVTPQPYQVSFSLCPSLDPVCAGDLSGAPWITGTARIGTDLASPPLGFKAHRNPDPAP